MEKHILVGDKFDTGIGECVVLYESNNVHGKFLILFNGEKFVKANGYDFDEDTNQLFWRQGEYYYNFLNLAMALTELVDKSIGLK